MIDVIGVIILIFNAVQWLIFLKNNSPVDKGVNERTCTHKIHSSWVNILQNNTIQKIILNNRTYTNMNHSEKQYT